MQLLKRRSGAIYLTEMGAFIARRITGAYGMGVDYAYTMVHKAPSRQKSEHHTLAPVPAR